MAELPRVYLKTGREGPAFGRHPWLFSGAVDRIEGKPANGAEVTVISGTGAFVAHGLYNANSQIRVRLYSWDQEVRLTHDFWHNRIACAIHLRSSLGLMGQETGCRLVFSEGDMLSGLVVDRYRDILAVQFTSLGLFLQQDLIVDSLVTLLQPAVVYLRTEKGMRELEGIEAQDQVIRGNMPEGPVTIVENNISFLVDLHTGHKTGYYLDQRDNRKAAAAYAVGRRCLDICCYSGGFSLNLAKAGAVEVTAIDSSENALALAGQNASLNNLRNITWVRSDAFKMLDKMASDHESFGLVVLDPPRFAQSSRGVDQALKGYTQLNSQALKICAENAIFVSCSCSGRVSDQELIRVISNAAARENRNVQILEVRGQPPDHPVLASCPESAYLKCIICRVI